jgi:hypothetical protein
LKSFGSVAARAKPAAATAIRTLPTNAILSCLPTVIVNTSKIGSVMQG